MIQPEDIHGFEAQPFVVREGVKDPGPRPMTQQERLIVMMSRVADEARLAHEEGWGSKGHIHIGAMMVGFVVDMDNISHGLIEYREFTEELLEGLRGVGLAQVVEGVDLAVSILIRNDGTDIHESIIILTPNDAPKLPVPPASQQDLVAATIVAAMEKAGVTRTGPFRLEAGTASGKHSGLTAAFQRQLDLQANIDDQVDTLMEELDDLDKLWGGGEP